MEQSRIIIIILIIIGLFYYLFASQIEGMTPFEKIRKLLEEGKEIEAKAIFEKERKHIEIIKLDGDVVDADKKPVGPLQEKIAKEEVKEREQEKPKFREGYAQQAHKDIKYREALRRQRKLAERMRTIKWQGFRPFA